MASDESVLRVAAESVGDAVVLRPTGVLDSSTYRPLRDAIIKAALEEPHGVIVDVADLQVPAESALAVFTSARWHVDRWPEVPIVLVSESAHDRSALARNGVTRYVPVHPTLSGALAAVTGEPATSVRRRARAVLLAEAASLQRTRELIAQWLTAWSMPELIPTAKVVATTLVENVLRHTESCPTLRLEAKDATVTVAVTDADPRPAGVRESVAAYAQPSGLQIVAALCRAWGNTPNTSGKVVWAVLGPENTL
ncbi:hypothetical protein SAMN04489835_2488 [Mycolicibacterium rutilum]|uniref:STAS domain-containing protein n=1 Tax=Mycolicibacterium rutilum TaxID=370526 RepID=A0A1H6JXB1_MYCRU|nr:STAS domain-containing protein [Mycolicibacterium rutilum]SEH65276.1 hypothetical protein SAMN04489835_2488 [Mycolicibacterium rutilum]